MLLVTVPLISGLKRALQGPGGPGGPGGPPGPGGPGDNKNTTICMATCPEGYTRPSNKDYC